MTCFCNTSFEYNQDGYSLLERLLELPSNFLRYKYYYDPKCSLRRLSTIVRMEKARLKYGMLLFTADLKCVWSVKTNGLIGRCSWAEALQLITCTEITTFLVIRPAFCRRSADFKILTPLHFPQEALLPSLRQKSTCRQYLDNGWVRLVCERSSLQVARCSRGELTFRLLLPANSRRAVFTSV